MGDQGWDGITLGGHDPAGEALVDFQRELLALRRRGIVLAIASKNDGAVAVEAIEKHPEMVLTVEDFAAWRINWNDKAANIVEVMEELNLGLDSAVFIDDNPVERARVREAPPEGQPALGRHAPQLVARQGQYNSICSCQCDGPGPGPYCTCPENMQCEHLVDALGLGECPAARRHPAAHAVDGERTSIPCLSGAEKTGAGRPWQGIHPGRVALATQTAGRGAEPVAGQGSHYVRFWLASSPL